MRICKQNSGGDKNLLFQTNCLNTIRLLAAFQVFYGHAVVHLKLLSNDVVSTILGIFQGVPIFFMLSGFLIWHSIDRTPDFKSFLKKRILRLYPELWFAVIVGVLSIIVLYDGFILKDLILFIFGQAMILQFWTPDSLRAYGCGTPNGSLWTISVIVQFYLVAWFLKKKFQNVKNRTLLIGIFAGSLVIGIISPYLNCVVPQVIYKLYNQTIIPYLWIFILGALMCEYFTVLIPRFKKFWWIGLCLLLVNCFFYIDFGGNYGVIKTVLQGITWFGFAYAFPRINIKHDISYGIYLYHMVIINIFVQLNAVGLWGFLVASLILTILLSAISYVWIANCKMFRRK